MLDSNPWSVPFASLSSRSVLITCAGVAASARIASVWPFDLNVPIFLGGVIGHSGSFAPVALALGVLAAEWLFLLYLYRKGLFLRV